MALKDGLEQKHPSTEMFTSPSLLYQPPQFSYFNEHGSPSHSVWDKTQIDDFNELYFEHFFNSLLELKELYLSQSKKSENKLDHNEHSGHWTKEPNCECRECFLPGFWSVSSLNYLTLNCVYTDLKIDVLSTNCLHLTSSILSLFVGLDNLNSNELGTIGIIYNNIRVLIKQNDKNSKSRFNLDVDFATKQYTVNFDLDSVNFTSSANLLTYSLDKSGCKTKICKLKNIYQDDFVDKLFQSELSKNRFHSSSKCHPNNNKSVNNISAKDLSRKCQMKSYNYIGQDIIWTVDDCLQVTQHSNGNVCIANDQSAWYISLQNSQSSFCLQMDTICIILNKSGNLFVGLRIPGQTPEHDSGNKFGLIKEQIRLLNRKGCETINETGDNYPTVADHNDCCMLLQPYCNFNLSRTIMDSFEQYVVCGIGGLLVRHHTRRAGLNPKNQICLL